MYFNIPDVNIISILPEIVLLAVGSTLLFLQTRPERKITLSLTASCGVLLEGLLLLFFWNKKASGFDGLIVRDNLAILFHLVIVITVSLTIVFSHYYLRGDKQNRGEYYGLILYAATGMNLMVMASDLLVIYLGMEILSMSLYVLVGFFKDTSEGIEATVKYYLLGAFSSAIFLLGVSFYYGILGRTDLTFLLLSDTASVFNTVFFFVAVALIFVGLGFKIASVPFHMWAPDTYEGAPMSIASLLSVAPKVAAFAVLLRFGLGITDINRDAMVYAIGFMAVTSMIIGNFAALRQSGLIRMLAYSGIGQIGFMLIGLLAIPWGGGAALMFYLFVYAFMNMGAFGIAIHLSAREGRRLQIIDMSGLADDHPLLALCMAVFMISLTGIPPTAGFFAKFYVFKVGIEAGYLEIVLVAIVMTIVSLYYYIRVVMVMYMGEAPTERILDHPGITFFSVILGILALAILIFGIIPGNLIDTITLAM
jgi:NADH-quinone oxidoreductase subunit N